MAIGHLTSQMSHDVIVVTILLHLCIYLNDLRQRT
jgi:hypothetical protein